MPEHLRVAIKARRPVRVAQDGALRVILFVLQDERSPEGGTNPQPGEEVSAHHVTAALLKIVPKANSYLARRQRNKSHQLTEDTVILAQLLEHRLRYGSVVVAGLRGALRLILIVEIYEPIRV